MPNTPLYGLPYPDMADPANVPADIRGLAESFEQLVQDIAYAEITAPQVVAATSEASSQNIVVMPPVTFTSSFPVIVQFFAPYAISPATANAVLSLWLFEDNLSLGRIGQLKAASDVASSTPLFLARRHNPTVGQHTYAVRASVTGSKTGTVGAGLGGAGKDSPALVRIRRV
jgi:hypothetical protein